MSMYRKARSVDIYYGKEIDRMVSILISNKSSKNKIKEICNVVHSYPKSMKYDEMLIRIKRITLEVHPYDHLKYTSIRDYLRSM